MLTNKLLYNQPITVQHLEYGSAMCCHWLDQMFAEGQKVRIFWEAHKIWKNLSHGLVFYSKRPNHEEDFFKFFWALKSLNIDKEIKLDGLDLKGNLQTQLDKNYFIFKENLNSV